jgi:Protein of unknown function (DUF4232)
MRRFRHIPREGIMKKIVLLVPIGAVALATMIACSSGTSTAANSTTGSSAAGSSAVTWVPVVPDRATGSSSTPNPSSAAAAKSNPPAVATDATTAAKDSASAAVALKPCTGAQLSVLPQPNNPGVGNIGRAIVLRNTSSTTCMVQGYPGAAGEDTMGRQIAQATRVRSSMYGGIPGDGTSIPPVVLRPNGVASVSVSSANVGTKAGCVKFVNMYFTPPNTTTTRELNLGLTSCDFRVTPAVAGPTGFAS